MHNRLFMTALLFSAVAISCTPTEQTTTEEPPPVVLGAVYCLTGDQAELDVPSAHGAELAMTHVMQEGGVLGRRVILDIEDGATNPGTIAQAVDALMALHSDVAAFLGLSDTDMATSAARAAERHGRVFLTSGATSPHLPDVAPGYVYLTCFGDNIQALAAATWAIAHTEVKRPVTACLITDTTDTYTCLLRQYFVERFTAEGGQIVSDLRIGTDTTALNLDSIPACDVIYLAAHVSHNAIPLITQLRTKYPTTPIIGGDGYDAKSIWEEHPEIGNVFYTTHAYLGADSDNPEVIAFRDEYMKEYGTEPNAFAALGYDAVRLVIAAIDKAGSARPDSVRAALSSIQHFDGITGTISYRSGSPIPAKSVSIIEVANGRRSLKATVTP